MSSFIKNETGAITVDWVVISAGLVGLGIAVTSMVSGAVNDRTDAVRSTINRAQIITEFGAWQLGDTFDLTTIPDDAVTVNTPIGTQVTVSDLDGWVSSTGMFRVIDEGVNGVNTPGGLGFIATEQGGQNTSLTRTMDEFVAGEEYELSFNAAALSSVNKVEVWYGGDLLGTVQPGDTTMKPYSFALTGGAGDGTNQIELREIGVINGNSTYLADITIR